MSWTYTTTTPRLKELLLGAAPETLREARVLFTHLGARWVLKMEEAGYEIAHGEGYVALTDAADGDHDGPHKAGGAHYMGTGGDQNLYVDGAFVDEGGKRVWKVVYVKSSDHPAWKVGGALWLPLHPSCRWGGDFTRPDANHISVAWGGRS